MPAIGGDGMPARCKTQVERLPEIQEGPAVELNAYLVLTYFAGVQYQGASRSADARQGIDVAGLPSRSGEGIGG